MAEMEPDDLDGWFAAARERPPVPEPAFLERLAQDAARLRPVPRVSVGRPAMPRAPLAGRRARPASGLGGWRALSGLATAAVAGLWIGLALPDSLRDLTPLDGSSETLDLFAAADDYSGES